jgi:hypothetical protein
VRVFSKTLSEEEAASAVGLSDNLANETAVPDMVIGAEELTMRLDALGQLHPALGRAVNSQKKYASDPVRFQKEILRSLGGERVFNEIQQRLFKSSILDELDKAQARAPSPQALEKGIAATLKDPATGPAFLSKLGLAERMAGETSAVAAALRRVRQRRIQLG